jgi:hypothetical protein
MPRLASGPYSRTRRPRPSEKITLRIVSRSSPQGHPSLHGPPRGGAGSARPQGRHHAKPNAASFGHHALANEPVTVTCPGSRPALIRGRGDRVPPRKSPFASFPGLPRKATLACIAHPAEGRAPHARKARLRRLLEVHWTRRAEPSVPTGIALGARSRY